MLENKNLEAQKLKDEELEQVSGGFNHIMSSDVPSDSAQEIKKYQSQTYIHGIIKAPEKAGFAAGQKCGGTVRFYRDYFTGYECDRCGEFWRLIGGRKDSTILFSGNFFNLEK